jgi:4-carboxymuconolactone decarboxylase
MDARADTSQSTTRGERFARGLEVMGQVDGGLGERVLRSLAGTSPEPGHQVVAWGFGEICSRPELVLRDRQLVTLGMLTALAAARPSWRCTSTSP